MSVEAEELSYGTLRRQIEDLQRKGVDTSESWVDLHLKLALPAASLMMILIAAPARGRRNAGRQRGRSMAVGFVIGFGYFVVVAFARALGQTRHAPARGRRMGRQCRVRAHRRLLSARVRLTLVLRGRAAAASRAVGLRQARASRSCTGPPGRRRLCRGCRWRSRPRRCPRRARPSASRSTQRLRAPHLAQLGRRSLSPQHDERLLRVRLPVELARAGCRPPARTYIVLRMPRLTGSRCGTNTTPAVATGRAQLLLDLRPVPVRADAVGAEVLVDLGEELLRPWRSGRRPWCPTSRRSRRARGAAPLARAARARAARRSDSTRGPPRAAPRAVDRDRAPAARTPPRPAARAPGARRTSARTRRHRGSGSRRTGRAPRAPRAQTLDDDRRRRPVRQRGEDDLRGRRRGGRIGRPERRLDDAARGTGRPRRHAWPRYCSDERCVSSTPGCRASRRSSSTPV